MYPKEFFQDGNGTEELGRCFVLMPFADAFTTVYEAITEAVEGPEIGFACIRADELFGGGHIIEDILTEIARAEVTIADVTTRNPNVFYELGIVHMVKDKEKVFILAQDMADVPFDIQQFRCLEYRTDDLPNLRHDLVAAFDAIGGESFTLTGIDGDCVECDRKLLGTDRWMYSLELPELHVFPGFAKFELRLTRAAINRGMETVFDEGVALERGEQFSLPNVGWSMTLTRVQNREATFRLARQRPIPPRDG